MKLWESNTTRRKREDREREQAETLRACAELAELEERKDLTDTQLVSLDNILKHVEEGDKRWNNVKKH